MVRNKDHRPHDYTETDDYPRPSHADWTYLLKYGIKASSGGGRSSARETIGASRATNPYASGRQMPTHRIAHITDSGCPPRYSGRVAAGTIAERYLKMAYGVEIVAFVSSVGKIHIPDSAGDDDLLSEEYLQLMHGLTREKVDENTVRCPHQETAELMEEVRPLVPSRSNSNFWLTRLAATTQRIHEAKANNDSIGGTVTCVIRHSPVGLGEPVFDKLEAKLAHAMLSIPATKGFEIGSGFKGCEVPGSLHNDAFMQKPDGRLGTKTNRSGGIQGGITNGEDIYFK